VAVAEAPGSFTSPQSFKVNCHEQHKCGAGERKKYPARFSRDLDVLEDSGVASRSRPVRALDYRTAQPDHSQARSPFDPEKAMSNQKEFVLTFTSGADTRWLADDERVRRCLESLATGCGEVFTNGTRPAVEVVIVKPMEPDENGLYIL
jgi:hypothetical protein